VFQVSSPQISTCLSDIGFSTGFTCYFVYTVFSNSDVGFCLFGLMIFCVVLAVLNAIFVCVPE